MKKYNNINLSSRLGPVLDDIELGGKLSAKNHQVSHCFDRDNGRYKAIGYAREQMDSGSENRQDTIGQVSLDSTTIMTDAAPATNVAIGSPSIPPPAVMPIPAQINSNIETFLRKPYEVASGTLVGASFPPVFYDVMEFLNSVELYNSKLKGFYGVRATPVFTLKITANRFTSGLYALSFLPTGGSGGGHADIVDRGRSFTRTQRSQLLTAYVDLNIDSSIQLTIPWTSVFPYWQTRRIGVQTFLQSPGRLILYRFVAPVDITGAVPVATYSLYVHYEDVILYGAAIPQSGAPDFFAEYQAGGRIRRSARGEKDIASQEMETTGPISGGFSLVSKAASALSTIPTLTAIATPVAWVTDALARAASWFGYSAPAVLDSPVRMYHETVPYLSTFDKHSVAEPLGLSAKNFLSPVDGLAGTSFDEMSIDYIKSKFAFFEDDVWSTTDAIGTVITNLTLAPRNFGTSQVDGSTTLYSPTPLSMLCRMFKFWRGSIIIKIRIVKTEFHIGRLQIIYDPLAGSTPGAVNASGAAHTYRRILDIREGNEVDIVIPYISEMVWKNTEASAGFDALGRFLIYVDDQLSAGAGYTASSVRLLFFVCGGPDFAVASRRAPVYSAAMPSAVYQSGTMEMGTPDRDTPAATTTLFDNLGDYKDIVHKSGSCMGEVVVSLNQLLKAGGVVSNVGSYNLPEGTIQPYHWEYSNIVAGVPTVGVSDDPFSLFSGMFAMYRGGIRLTIIYFDNDGSGLTLAVYQADDPGTINVVASGAVDPILLTPWDGFTAVKKSQGVLSVDVPFQHILPVSVTNDQGFWTGTSPFSHTSASVRARVYFEHYTASGAFESRRFLLHRAGANDGAFSCFTSVPPSLVA